MGIRANNNKDGGHVGRLRFGVIGLVMVFMIYEVLNCFSVVILIHIISSG